MSFDTILLKAFKNCLRGRNLDVKTASKLIEDNLHNIYSWSYSKVFDKNEAEDLAQEIILACLKSVSKIEKDSAFWRYFWRIAENKLCSYIRKKSHNTVEYDDRYMGIYWKSPEEELIEAEEVITLKRELSLLSKLYREITVKYYIYGMSCKEISKAFGINVETVKFYLYKARKILRDGVEMKREYGEKSYNPHTFVMNFWGEDSSGFWEIFERKLPGNILLSTYDSPMTVTQLSLELGVASVYLEDEINILENMGLIKKISDRYQTNIIILKDSLEKKLYNDAKPICDKTAALVVDEFKKVMANLEFPEFYPEGFDENSFRWIYLNLALYVALFDHDKSCTELYGEYPILSNGSCGFVFGHDNNYKNTHWSAFYGKYENQDKSVWVSVQNYKMLDNVQRWTSGKNWIKSMEAMCDSALFKAANENNSELLRLIDSGFIKSDSGHLTPLFPVFSGKQLLESKKTLSPVINICRDYINVICEHAAEVLQKEVPSGLKNYSKLFAHVWYQLEAMAQVMERFVDAGFLTIPNVRKNLCAFAVKIESDKE